jgi:flagellar biosynthetic protein FliR
MDAVAMVQFAVRLVRPGALVMAAPTIGGAHIPVLVRVGLTVALAVVLVPVSNAAVPNLSVLPAVILRELAIGLALALATRIVVAAAEVAGSMAGLQIGYGYASIVDPQSGAQNGVLSTLYGLIATGVMFAGNVHHALIQALASSYQVLPIGAGSVDPATVTSAARVVGVVFAVGVQLAAPVLIVLLLVDTAMGVMARATPSLNIMSVGFGVKLIAGLIVLAQTAFVLPDIVMYAVKLALDAAMRLAEAVG